MDSYIIYDRGYLKQELGQKKQKYDKFDLSEMVDLEALKKQGYKKVKIQFTTVIEKGDGGPCIKLTNCKTESKKKLKKSTLLEKEGIGKKDIDKNYTFKMEKTIPIDKMKDTIYVYYNSDTLMKSSWKSDTCTVELSFIK